MLFKLLRFTDEAGRERRLEDYRRRCIALEQTGRRYEWSEVADSFLRGFREVFEVEITEDRLSTWESERWGDLAKVYASETWLRNAESRAFPR